MAKTRDLSHLESGGPARQATLAVIRHVNGIRRSLGWKTWKPSSDNNVAVHRLDDAFSNGVQLGRVLEAIEIVVRVHGGTCNDSGYHLHPHWVANNVHVLGDPQKNPLQVIKGD